MSIASNARSSQVARNIKSGSYIGMARFAGYNEATEGIMAQQREADRRLKQIQAERAIRLAKGVA
jgi:hypothetical protein